MSTKIADDTRALMASQIMSAYLQNDALMDRFAEMAGSEGFEMFELVAAMAVSHVDQLVNALNGAKNEKAGTDSNHE